MSQNSIDDPAAPRPGWPLVVNSLLFMAALLFLGGVFLGLFWQWDLPVWLAAILFVGPCLAPAFWQYSATFRASHRSAKRLFVSLAMAGGFFIFALLTTIIEPLASGIIPTINYLGYAILPIGAVAGWFIFTLVLTRRWRQRLADAATAAATANSGFPRQPLPSASGAHPQEIPHSRLRTSLHVLAALAVVAAGFVFAIHDPAPERAMHVSPAAAHLTLPAGATDVCVLRGHRGTITYDFAISESGFLDWAKQHVGSLESQAAGVPLGPITDPVLITTITEHSEAEIPRHTAQHGWYYDWRKSDRAIEYCYDLDTGRAYYHAHFH